MALIARWLFNTNSDDSGNGYSFTTNGTLNRNGFMAFDGATYADVNGLTQLPDTCTIRLVIRPTDMSGNYAWVALNATTPDNIFQIGMWWPDFNVLLANESWHPGSPSAYLAVGKQSVIVVVFEAQTSGTLCRLYIDAVYIGSYTFSGKFSSSATGRKAFTIGQEWDGSSRSDYFKGEMYLVDIYDTAFTEQEAIASCSFSASPVAKEMASRTFSNNESREDAWPGETSTKESTGKTHKNQFPIIDVSTTLTPPVRTDLGFIEGIVTRKQVIASGKTVVCLDDRFNLVAKTVTNAAGYYRFDMLSIDRLYAIHAYDNQSYQYAPVGADRRKPEAYA